MIKYLKPIICTVLCATISWGYSQSHEKSSTYDALVELFVGFREAQKPAIVDGLPDYSEAGMDRKHIEMKNYQKRLADIDTTGWSKSLQVDYLLVWAEMNAVEFHHRVLKPWKHDPGFYSFFGAGDAGASMNLEDIMPVFFDFEGPLNKEQKAQLKTGLKMVPAILEQAKVNLTEGSGDLAAFAIRNFEQEAEFFNAMGEDFFKRRKRFDQACKKRSNSNRGIPPMDHCQQT